MFWLSGLPWTNLVDVRLGAECHAPPSKDRAPAGVSTFFMHLKSTGRYVHFLNSTGLHIFLSGSNIDLMSKVTWYIVIPWIQQGTRGILSNRDMRHWYNLKLIYISTPLRQT